MEKITIESLKGDFLTMTGYILNYYFQFDPDFEGISKEDIDDYLQDYNKFTARPINQSNIEGKNAKYIFKCVFTKIISETVKEDVSLLVKIKNGENTKTIVSIEGNNITNITYDEVSELNDNDKELLHTILNTILQTNLLKIFVNDALEKTNDLINQYNKNKKGGKRRSTKKKRKSTKNRSSHQ